MSVIPDKNWRILLMGPRPPAAGGVARFIENCLKSLPEVEMTVYDTGRPIGANVSKSATKGYLNLFDGGIRHAIRKMIVTIKHMVVFPFFLLKKRPHIVQIQFSLDWSFWENSYYLLCLNLFGINSIIRLGSSNMESFFSGHGFSCKVKIAILKRADRIIVQSVYWHVFFSKLVEKDILVIIGNVVDVVPVDTEKDMHGEVHILFQAGIEAHRKGAYDVLKVAQKINNDTGMQCRFHCIASTQEIYNKTKELNLTDIVELHPYLQGLQKSALLKKCHIFLLPSYSEGFPNSLLEAMAYGMAVITTKVGAIPEVVKDGYNGYLVQQGNIEEIYTSIKKLILDSDSISRMGKANIGEVGSKYSLNTLRELLTCLYSGLLDSIRV